MEDSEINSEKFLQLVNSKERLCCARCGSVEFNLIPTGLPNTTIDEAIFMECKKCSHKRLELLKQEVGK